MLPKNLLLFSVACFSFHENFGAELKWQYVGQQKLEVSDVRNPVAIFMGAKIATGKSRGYNVDAFDHHSSVAIAFKKKERTVSRFKIEGYRLFVLHPLVENNNQMHLYVKERSTGELYKCSFELQAPVEAKAKE